MDVKVRVVVLSARIGAGHDGAAAELARRLRALACDVARHDYLDLLPGRLGQRLCDAYHRELEVAPRSWDWLLAAAGTKPLAGLAARASALAGPKLLDALGNSPGLVVSTYPLATQALGELRRRGVLNVPVAAYLTDPAVHRLAVNRFADLHIAPNPRAALAARRFGAPRAVSAQPAVARGFRPAAPGERKRAREKFGLEPEGRFALVLSGSWGVGDVERITIDVAGTGVARPVVVCGRNEALRKRLRRRGFPHVFGWVEDMPRLMRACDVVVQNAGGLTSLEALAAGLPVLTYRCLPGHGRANARALDEMGLVPAVSGPAALADALQVVKAPGLPPGDDPAALLARVAGMREVAVAA
ncbi:glycosyltransferase [Amycolatopsis acidicola]|uniref:Glycosyltransferase n=1 Tax=Amycolatopsis acidicola TaxID=2596893 RepID=A0A5N0VBT0_9PSEU|nr:glycosyltransferase [Amycolatopsis acidicola]KAA9162580.1 glycosyltransferase [Amycolatopsis acidicola]